MTAQIEDTLDSVDYDPIDHLNALFSHPATLSSIPAVSQVLHNHVTQLDNDIAKLVAAQISTNEMSMQRIETAKRDLAELFKGIEAVRERAVRTELTITEMTADIKKLDGTKKNLAVSMTALKRLQMLTTAYEQLKALCRTRQYRECAQLLQAVIQLMAHFRSYRSIDQIAILSRNVADLQSDLLEQVCEDFEIVFAKGEVPSKRGMLAEGCLVMDSLGPNARSRLITWYCNTQLREYRQVFRGNDEAASLDNISRRYAWLKRILKTYEDEHSSIFPASWKTSEALTKSFCDGTREDFKGILSKSMRKSDGKNMDVNLLLSCLQETLDFELWLEKRFAAADQRASIDTMRSTDDRPLIFGKAISEAFEPYLSIWIEQQDKQLLSMIRKYRINPQPPDDDSPASVLPSSIELFHFYRLTLAQCAKLSTGSKLLDLSRTFGKYLDEYASDVLMHFIPEKQNPGIGGPSLIDISVIMNTADYCQTTTAQLEEKIKSKIDEDLRQKVDFEKQQDAFLSVASASIRLLVKRVEVECETSWREMRNISWSRIENVTDQSSYVSELVKTVRRKSEEVLKVLTKERYIRAFCDKLVESLANNFINNIVLCKPISDIGAEQMLLDSYILRKGFEDLPILTAESGANAVSSSGYLKHLTRTFHKVDSLLKTLQVQANPPEALVQAYFIHIADKSEANFRKILELKGISRRPEQAQLVELFHANMPIASASGSGGKYGESELVEANTVLSPLLVQAASAGGAGIGSGSAMGGLGSTGLDRFADKYKFDAGALGNALINAARDGVDRLAMERKERERERDKEKEAAGSTLLLGLSSGSGGGNEGGEKEGPTGSSSLGATGLGISVGDSSGDFANAPANDISITSSNSSTSTLPVTGLSSSSSIPTSFATAGNHSTFSVPNTLLATSNPTPASESSRLGFGNLGTLDLSMGGENLRNMNLSFGRFFRRGGGSSSSGSGGGAQGKE